MKCYYHDNKEVIAACTECGKFICEECKVNINGKAVCKVCIENGVFNSNHGYNTYNYNGMNQQGNNYYIKKSTQKSWLVTLLLCLFVGTVGVHRFYVGKIGTGILQLLTFGGFGIWTLVDFILIACKKFTDANGDLILD
ncbi:MAG: NINE protein [Clostridium celatum]|nr:NINE protein [Clostridium celatum]MDU2122966.1 NINE protein [Clostridium celatum]MDU4978293.1 NINE protein [Clostridium celatum]